MAATLIHIKSKMLLPKDPELEKITGEDDPRRELVERLIEHERFKNAAEMLQQKRLIEENVWSNPQIKQFLSDDDNPGLAVTLFDLVKTFQQVLDRARDRPVFEVNQEDVSVPEMILHIRSLVRSRPKGEAIPVGELFEQQRSRRAMICLFLAILELARMQAIVLVQSDAFGAIALKAHDRIEEALDSEQAFNEIEKEYH